MSQMVKNPMKFDTILFKMVKRNFIKIPTTVHKEVDVKFGDNYIRVKIENIPTIAEFPARIARIEQYNLYRIEIPSQYRDIINKYRAKTTSISVILSEF